MAEANIVQDFIIGQTRIKIADNYCQIPAAEVDQTLRRVAQHAQEYMSATAEAVRDYKKVKTETEKELKKCLS